MPNTIQHIVERINELQDELAAALEERGEKFRYSIENRRIRFKSDAIKWQKQFKLVLWKYLFNARVLNVVTAPIIYSLIVPFVILDIWVSLYQAICFPAYGMQKVRRRDYIVFDRHHLAYLNLVEKLNCAFCSYCNGLLAYISEIASRTEAYWCPIKHARKLNSYHRWYSDFSDYGDAENYRDDLKRNSDAVLRDNKTTKEQ